VSPPRAPWTALGPSLGEGAAGEASQVGEIEEPALPQLLTLRADRGPHYLHPRPGQDELEGGARLERRGGAK
jgi:hypothetical protein